VARRRFRHQRLCGVTVPVYFHESPDRITYILKPLRRARNLRGRREQLTTFLACRAELLELEHVIVADGGSDVPTECLRYET